MSPLVHRIYACTKSTARDGPIVATSPPAADLPCRGVRAAAADGLTALSIASIFQPDYAILDLSLHDITGLDLARRLREALSSGRPYLIALTAYGDEVMREACLAAGFDAYLLKTADIQALETLLEQ